MSDETPELTDFKRTSTITDSECSRVSTSPPQPGNRDISDQWTLFGRKTQQSKVVFFSQVIILYIIILTCLVNITIGSKDFNLWSTLLASSIGYLLPAPKLKDRKDVQL